LKVKWSFCRTIIRRLRAEIQNETEEKGMDAVEIEEKIYSKVGGWLCLDFHNTVPSYRLSNPNYDYFKSYTDLTRWARQAELFTEKEEQKLNRKAAEIPEKAQQILSKARELRDDIDGVFTAIAAGQQVESDLLEKLNAEIAETMSHACIGQVGGEYTWGWNGFPDEMESLLWPIVRSVAELLVNHERLERVRECAGDTCGWLFVDTSKNHSRRWCDMRDCGNTAKARRHYERKRKT
jgi:predicted RNA-binding Zn ribbon-like protein